MMASRLDLSRRLGGVLAAADAAGLEILDVGTALAVPGTTTGMIPIGSGETAAWARPAAVNPASLAKRLLLPPGPGGAGDLP
jgi:hypothetical protein